MEKMEIVGEIKHEKSGKRVVVTEEDVDDIMCSALEGGIAYWCDSARVQKDKRVASWGHEQIARGGELKIHVCEPFDDEDTEWYTLNKEKFMKGLEMYLHDPRYECIMCRYDHPVCIVRRGSLRIIFLPDGKQMRTMS